MVLGWVITALAISLGAPFWFDLLQKLLRLRSSGQRPDAQGREGAVAVKENGSVPAGEPHSAFHGAGPRTIFERTSLSDSDIRDLQRALGLPEHQVTKVLDTPTRTRVRDMQLRLGMPPTGHVDLAFLTAMRRQ
jgi:hypothetical protein